MLVCLKVDLIIQVILNVTKTRPVQFFRYVVSGFVFKYIFGLLSLV